MSTLARTLRVGAATVVLTLTLALLTGLTAVAAEDRPGGFTTPHHRYLKSTCVQVDENSWQVTHKWRARGGRYLNLGNGFKWESQNDNVWGGGKRIVKTRTIISGMFDGPTEPPTTARAYYSHYVAPIGKRHKAEELYAERKVNLSCPAAE